MEPRMEQLSDAQFEARYGPWSGLTPTEMAAVLSGYRGDWWVVGGWASEAFTGVSRKHEDIDVVVRRCDPASVCAYLSRQFHLWWNQDGTFRFIEATAGDEQLPFGSF